MHKTVLANGLTVVSEHREQASSTLLCYWVRAGGHYEEHYPYGIAHLLEHMMFKGTGTRTKEQISYDIEHYGGHLGAGTSTDRTRYYAYMPYDRMKDGISLLTDMVFHSTFPERELELEKKVVIEEIHRARDNPREFGGRTLTRTLRAMHPERASNLGTEESVSGITRDDLLRFHREFYGAGNIVLAATGHVRHDELVAALNELDIPAGSGPAYRLGKLRPYELGGQLIHEARDIRQAQLYWGMYGPDAYDDAKYAGYVAMHALGGGQASRLWRSVRGDKGLAYEVWATMSPMVSEGFITGYVATDPLRLAEAKSIITGELERLRKERLPDEELTRAQQAITGRHLIAQDKPEAINANMAARYLYDLNTDPRYFAERIRAVTSEAVLDFANAYLDPSRMLYVQVSREADAGAGGTGGESGSESQAAG
ncbi:M16 family metallopeptidase [Paenibacillus sp. GYB003]|uniref:M16 family metallopeptidase n=1 Tax=Paenibacillus sp. GYB003 TaxID=2994392 RepID=UPI002F96CFAD